MALTCRDRAYVSVLPDLDCRPLLDHTCGTGAQIHCKKRGWPATKRPRGARNDDSRRACVPHMRLYTLKAHGHIPKDHRGSDKLPMARDSLGDHAGVLQKVSQAALTDGVLPNEHYRINIMTQTATLRCMVDSFGKIRKLFCMFHGVRIPKSTLNHFCDKVASELDPLYQEIKRDLNTGRPVNGDTTGWFINGQDGMCGSLWERTQTAMQVCSLR